MSGSGLIRRNHIRYTPASPHHATDYNETAPDGRGDGLTGVVETPGTRPFTGTKNPGTGEKVLACGPRLRTVNKTEEAAPGNFASQ